MVRRAARSISPLGASANALKFAGDPPTTTTALSSSSAMRPADGRRRRRKSDDARRPSLLWHFAWHASFNLDLINARRHPHHRPSEAASIDQCIDRLNRLPPLVLRKHRRRRGDSSFVAKLPASSASERAPTRPPSKQPPTRRTSSSRRPGMEWTQTKHRFLPPVRLLVSIHPDF